MEKEQKPMKGAEARKVIFNLWAESEILSTAIVERRAADQARFNANYLRLINQPLVVC